MEAATITALTALIVAATTSLLTIAAFILARLDRAADRKASVARNAVVVQAVTEIKRTVDTAKATGDATHELVNGAQLPTLRAAAGALRALAISSRLPADAARADEADANLAEHQKRVDAANATKPKEEPCP